jgi:hypothetical protein
MPTYYQYDLYEKGVAPFEDLSSTVRNAITQLPILEAKYARISDKYAASRAKDAANPALQQPELDCGFVYANDGGRTMNSVDLAILKGGNDKDGWQSLVKPGQNVRDGSLTAEQKAILFDSYDPGLGMSGGNAGPSVWTDADAVGMKCTPIEGPDAFVLVKHSATSNTLLERRGRVKKRIRALEEILYGE